jgi:hypothetical protein
MEPLVEALLERGANASQQNLDGQTPLAVLFETPRVERVTERIVEMLVDKEAEVSQSVNLKAARRFPKNEGIMRELLLTYSFQVEDLQQTSESHSTDAEYQWWNEWVRLAREGNNMEWPDLKRVLSQSHMRTYPKTGPKFAVTALAVLVETYISTFQDEEWETPDEEDRRRGHLAEVLRLCRSQELPIGMRCFDYLIELCL